MHKSHVSDSNPRPTSLPKVGSSVRVYFFQNAGLASKSNTLIIYFKNYVNVSNTGMDSLADGPMVSITTTSNRRKVGFRFESRKWHLNYMYPAVLWSTYLRVIVKDNPNRVIFYTTLRACSTTVRVLMQLLFLAHSIRFGLGLG